MEESFLSPIQRLSLIILQIRFRELIFKHEIFYEVKRIRVFLYQWIVGQAYSHTFKAVGKVLSHHHHFRLSHSDGESKAMFYCAFVRLHSIFVTYATLFTARSLSRQPGCSNRLRQLFLPLFEVVGGEKKGMKVIIYDFRKLTVDFYFSFWSKLIVCCGTVSVFKIPCFPEPRSRGETPNSSSSNFLNELVCD